MMQDLAASSPIVDCIPSFFKKCIRNFTPVSVNGTSIRCDVLPLRPCYKHAAMPWLISQMYVENECASYLWRGSTEEDFRRTFPTMSCYESTKQSLSKWGYGCVIGVQFHDGWRVFHIGPTLFTKKRVILFKPRLSLIGKFNIIVVLELGLVELTNGRNPQLWCCTHLAS